MTQTSCPKSENLAALQEALREGEESEFADYSLKGLMEDLDGDVP